MLTTKTNAGTLLIQSGDDSVELTTAEVFRLMEQLVHDVALGAPELVRGVDEDGNDDWHCPHCHQGVIGTGAGLVEVDAGSVRHNSANVEGDSVHPSEDGGERDFHTIGWLCGHCECPVSVPAEMDVIHG